MPAIKTIEHRSTKRPVEVRSAADGKSVAFGYAAVFYNSADPNTQYELWTDHYERIMPGAFDRAVRENQDVRALFNHDTNCLLGRSSAGTLRLSVDSIGLKYEIDLPDTAAGRDCKISLDRKDLRESSFSFSCRENGKVVWRDETSDGESISIREVHDCDLFDVGPVTFAAYDASTAGVRADVRSSIQAERDQWLKERRTAQDEADEVDVIAAAVRVNEEL